MAVFFGAEIYMSTDYQDIIDALDAAILDQAAKPVTVNHKGRSFTYRTLTEMMEARKYFKSLLSESVISTPINKLRRTRTILGGMD